MTIDFHAPSHLSPGNCPRPNCEGIMSPWDRVIEYKKGVRANIYSMCTSCGYEIKSRRERDCRKIRAELEQVGCQYEDMLYFG